MKLFVDRFYELTGRSKSSEKVLDDLYGLSIKSLSIAVLSAILITIFLYDKLGQAIVLWFVSVLAVLSYRIYMAIAYRRSPSKYSLKKWYDQFFIAAVLTAVISSMLGVVFLPMMDPFHQLFIVMVLLGLGSGAAASLSSDYRLAVIYVSIIFLPMIVELFWIYDSLPFYVVPAVLSLYYMVYVMMVLNTYKQKMKISKLEKGQMLFHNIFNQASIPIFSFDKELRLLGTNDYFNTFFGHKPDVLNGIDLTSLPDKRVTKIFSKALKEGAQSYSGPYQTINGKEIWVDADVFPYVDVEDRVLGGICIIKDKTVEKNALNRLEHNSLHDALTGLLNRRGFEYRMQQLIENEAHNEQYSLLFYLDLNNFKGINDSLGHNIGDDVLKGVADRLLYSLEEDVFVSRFGGDEFVVTIPYISVSKEKSEEISKRYIARIQAALSDPFISNELYLYVQASIGIIVIEPKYQNISELIRYADIAMYQAKKKHSNISYYDETIDEMQKNLFILQHDLAQAQEKDQLDIFFQPVVDIRNDMIVSAEVLIRWEHPLKGLMNPSEFITLAIEAGLIYKITWWILERVCQAINRWKKEGIWKLHYISINVNAQQLVEQNFANYFLAILQKYGIDTKEIIIEITERSLIDNFENTQNVISQLRQNGVRCAIDDFGVGYSSLSYLKRLSFYTLKIDKEFIKEVEHKPQALNLLRSILQIGRGFNYNIIVEGVEHEKQKNMLMKIDKNLYYQGYLFSGPVNEKAFEENFLKRD